MLLEEKVPPLSLLPLFYRFDLDLDDPMDSTLVSEPSKVLDSSVAKKQKRKAKEKGSPPRNPKCQIEEKEGRRERKTHRKAFGIAGKGAPPFGQRQFLSTQMRIGKPRHLGEEHTPPGAKNPNPRTDRKSNPKKSKGKGQKRKRETALCRISTYRSSPAKWHRHCTA